MKKPRKVSLDETKALMGALLRQPPKQHDEMKLGNASKGSKAKRKKKPGK